MNWWAAKAWVGYLNSTRYLGQNTWSLPTADLTCGGGSGGYNCTNGQLGALFYNSLGGVALQSITTTHNAGYSLFTSIQSGVYWYGTEYGGYPYNAWVFGTNNGGQGGGNKGRGDYFYTWAMLPGNVSTIAAVPEPGEWVMMLAGFGLIGAIVRRRKQI
ncbi:MAG: PEPxxWA-CTERM sorting domain-containing protein [Burkholderiales bacterium]|nr:PEPxxWA-CTERM sorting domain-containing protein [Burkholderiales bacterium]